MTNGHILRGRLRLVKIINDYGDIKTGRQAGSCYQRHYGIQMRRTISPKTGQESRPQASQRRRFINGLAFRKALSQQAKTYLDGYCIAHRLVDSFGVSLTWDKLAMKICLQQPKVALLPPA